jgi:hypothetical protein
MGGWLRSATERILEVLYSFRKPLAQLTDQMAANQ